MDNKRYEIRLAIAKSALYRRSVRGRPTAHPRTMAKRH